MNRLHKRACKGELIIAAYEFMRDRGLNIKQFSLIAGLNSKELWDYLHGNYFGGFARVEETIASVIKHEQEKRFPLKSEHPFIETSVSQRIFNALRLCHSQKDISILFGESGIGKTASSREYAVKHKDSILIECLTSSSATPLFRKLCELFGLSSNLNLWQSFNLIEKRLRDSGQLIIVDEAEGVSVRGLDLLRRLNDFTGTGIVMIGMPGLLNNIRGNRSDFKYLFSRVGMAVKLDTINEADAEQLVRAWLPSSSNLWPEFWNVANANARRLSKLCKMAMHIADVNDRPIDREIILKAAEVLIS